MTHRGGGDLFHVSRWAAGGGAVPTKGEQGVVGDDDADLLGEGGGCWMGKVGRTGILSRCARGAVPWS